MVLYFVRPFYHATVYCIIHSAVSLFCHLIDRVYLRGSNMQLCLSLLYCSIKCIYSVSIIQYCSQHPSHIFLECMHVIYKKF
jgi:hypothetical protein